LKTLKRIFTAIALTLGLIGIQPAHAGIPTIDVAAITQAILQVQAWAEQYSQMVKQLEEMQRSYENLSGVRGMGSLADDPASRKYLPDDYQEVHNNGVGRWQEILETNRIYDIEETGLSEDSDTVKEYKESAKQAAINQAAAEESYKSASQRFDALQVLLNKINDAPDAKDIADLQARIQIEQAMLQNESNKLQAMSQFTAAQQVLEHQRLIQIRMKATQGELGITR
jgi:type IV secretion system protein VirB5